MDTSALTSGQHRRRVGSRSPPPHHAPKHPSRGKEALSGDPGKNPRAHCHPKMRKSGAYFHPTAGKTGRRGGPRIWGPQRWGPGHHHPTTRKTDARVGDPGYRVVRKAGIGVKPTSGVCRPGRVCRLGLLGVAAAPHFHSNSASSPRSCHWQSGTCLIHGF